MLFHVDNAEDHAETWQRAKMLQLLNGNDDNGKGSCWLQQEQFLKDENNDC